MILINATYDTVSHKSAEHGESADSGFLWTNAQYTFKELVDLIERGYFNNCSCYPATGDTREWLTNEPCEDYATGETTTESIHYSKDNLPRSEKYWRKAFVAAGLIKG
jgi:hypothetical protein